MWDRAAWRAAGALVTVVAILWGSATAGLWLARQTETRYHTYPVAGTSMSLDLPGIDVAVVPGNAGVLTVERRLSWATTKPVTDERWDGQALAVTADCRSLPIGPGCGVDYTLRVPPLGSLVVRTGAGDLRATGLATDDVTLHTGSGDVDLRFAEAPRWLLIETGSGDIDVTVPQSTQYRIDAEADEPLVTVRQAPGATHVIIVRSTSGGLSIRPTSD